MLTPGGAKWFKVGQGSGMEAKVKQGGEGLGGLKLFSSVYEHSLDAKKRLTIPSDWRAMVGEPQRIFVLQAADGTHLDAMPASEMSKKLEKMADVSLADTASQDYLSVLAMRSELVTWDAQGRIRLRDDLLEFAGVKDSAVLVSTLKGFQIWSPRKWKEKQEKLLQVKTADVVRSFGF